MAAVKSLHGFFYCAGGRCPTRHIIQGSAVYVGPGEVTVVPVVAEWEQLEWSVVAPVGASRPGAGEGRWSSPLFLRSTELLPPSVAGVPGSPPFFPFPGLVI